MRPIGPATGAAAPEIIDLRATALRKQSPFQHVVFGRGALIPGDLAMELAETFPSEILHTSRRSAHGDKTYSVNTVVLHDDRQQAVPRPRLPPLWQEMLGAIAAPAYRYHIARLLGASARVIRLEVRLSEYAVDGWMSRHTDRPDKLFSQNIYFCPGWRLEWGGDLALFDSREAPGPSATYVPGLGTSVAFMRSDASWHEVRPVGPRARAPRRAMLIHGYQGTPQGGEGGANNWTG